MSRPNLILITTDQQRFDTIHHAGNKTIFTPHLNWLMAEGINFRRCYTDSPTCVAARATIMTGRHGFTNKLTTNAGDPKPMAVNPTLPGILTANGYQTRAVGKMHFSPVRANYGFEHMEILPDYIRTMKRYNLGMPKDHGVGENEMEPVFSTVDESNSITRWTVERSVDFLETRDDTRPFFLWTSFSKPHPPFDCDRKYWDLYDGADFDVPVYGNWSEKAEHVPDSLREITRVLNNVDRFSPSQLRNIKRAYYACISQIDYNLGYLFGRLREMELLENTWIIFTSDHGEILGDHWLAAKGIHLEGSNHVPMLIRPPKKDWHASGDHHGESCDEIVCLADILPTFLGAAGVHPPMELRDDGMDLMAVYRGERKREYLFGQCGEAFMLLEGSWKYHFMAKGGDELLFNLENDPMEQRDLIRTGEAPDQLEKMRRAMADFLTQHLPEAVREGRPVASQPARTEKEVNAQRWPGFHSREVVADVLH